MKHGVTRLNVYFVRARLTPLRRWTGGGLRESLGWEEDGDLNYNGGSRGGRFQVLMGSTERSAGLDPMTIRPRLPLREGTDPP